MALNPYPVEHDLKRELKRQELKAEATDFNLYRVNSPPLGAKSWLKASGLKSAVNTSQLAAGCFISRS